MAKRVFQFEKVDLIQTQGGRSTARFVNKLVQEKDDKGNPRIMAQDVINISLGASLDLMKLDSTKPVKITIEQ